MSAKQNPGEVDKSAEIDTLFKALVDKIEAICGPYQAEKFNVIKVKLNDACNFTKLTMQQKLK
jgi:hypothetical protein